MGAESIRSKEELKALLRIRDAHKDKEDEILDMLATSGAVLKGHFQLESGQHSSRFLRSANLKGNRVYLQSIANEIIADLQNNRVRFDAVLMQEAAGRSLGEIIANKLDKRKIIVETDDHNRPTGDLINETSLYRGDRVLIVSDLATTGSGLSRMTRLVRDKKAVPVAVALVATRNEKEMSEFEHQEGLRVYALCDLDFADRTFGKAGAECDEQECAECQKGEPVVLSWET